jgi:ERCC4-type nuclease
MLCSPTEPKPLKKLGKVSSVPENYGADFLIMGKKIRIGVQRKQFPGDLLASLTDGRLYDQLPRLSELDRAILVIEGHGRWTEDGELIGDSKYHRFTIQQLHGLLFTVMFEFNVPSIWVANMDDTARVLTNLEGWANKDKHTSLKSRPGAGKSSWGSTSEKHLAQHILQGFPGVGGELAGRIVDKFEGVPLTWTVGLDELMEVEGVGKKKADNMYHALDTIGEKK